MTLGFGVRFLIELGIRKTYVRFSKIEEVSEGKRIAERENGRRDEWVFDLLADVNISKRGEKS